MVTATLRRVFAPVGGTVRVVLFLTLALTPALAGFLAPVGPPAYRVELVGVDPGPAVGTGYADLSRSSRSTFDAVLAADDDRVVRRTDDPETLATPGETVVLRDGYAFRVVATRTGSPLRPVAILAGLLGSLGGTVAGAALVARWPR